VKQTALHWAVKRGYQDIVILLLSYGADPDFLNLVFRNLIHSFVNYVSREEDLHYIMPSKVNSVKSQE